MTPLCRLCLTENTEQNLENVFQYNIRYAEDSLVDILFWVFSVEIDVTDVYSKFICTKCIELVEYILQIKIVFQNNQKNLRDHLQNKICSTLGVQSLANAHKKVFNHIQEKPSLPDSVPMGTPSRKRCNSKNMYGSYSPRVRVSLSTLDAMCPVNLNIVPLEKTQEYSNYKRLKNGRFKKRKYRHFKLDDRLLEDICNTLDGKCSITDSSRRDIGVFTEISMLSKGVNTDDVAICICNKQMDKINMPTHLKVLPIDSPALNHVLSTDSCQKQTEDFIENDKNFLDIISIATDTALGRISPSGGQEYDWTTVKFKKDASTNTECMTMKTRSIGVNAKVPTVTTGTLTKRFKEMRKKNVVKINTELLDKFAPRVYLEPLDDVLNEINYKQIDEFTFIPKDDTSSESVSAENLEENDMNIDIEPQKPNTIDKKQKFLDYYKNFSSFAVRELITGKKIRDTDSDTSVIFKIANVCNVLVCDYCSQSFVSKISLDQHYKKAHKIANEVNNVIEVIDLVDIESSSPKRRRLPTKIRTKREWPLGKFTSKIYRDSEKMDTTGEKLSAKVNLITTDSVESTAQNNSCDDSEKRTNPVESTSGNNSNGNRIRKKRARNGSCSLKDIISFKTRIKQIIPKVKKKIGRKKKCERLKKPLLVREVKKDIPVWDRKHLGKYSAISYYRNYSSDDKTKTTSLRSPTRCDIRNKSDTALSETIQRLGNRLYGPSDSDKILIAI